MFGMSKVNDQSYVPAHLAIEAMRDNGYKNTAYALAELMDNSIEAGAKHVQLLCVEEEVQLTQRTRKRVESIAILDDGEGMNEEVLWIALQFGNGTRLSRRKRSGMGRFGMGLPASSISQCQRVDVWSWTDGIDKALWTFLDISEIKSGATTTVPKPINKRIPAIWNEYAEMNSASGTLVVWSNLDRLMWRSANAIIKNSEHLISRMYRKFIDVNHIVIDFIAFDKNNTNETSIKRQAKPNDPGYLMQNTSCPTPFDKEPMFQPYGKLPIEYEILYNNEIHQVRITFSYAKDEARKKDRAGREPFGQHAKKNIGISLVRADRELELDQSLVLQYDPRERWWGVEIEFPPALDEIFGVSNNKQTARNFSDLANIDIEALLEDKQTINQMKEEMKEEQDPRLPLIEIIELIKNNLNVIRNLIKAQSPKSDSPKRHSDVEEKATEITNKRKEDGYKGESDKDESLSPDERKGLIESTLEDEGVESKEAGELAAVTLSNNLKYMFVTRPIETTAFFSVQPKGGVIIITINSKHPAYDNLVEVLDESSEINESDLQSRLNKASTGLKLLLIAWARYEDELPHGTRKDVAQETRQDWGRIARDFLR